MSTQTTQGVSTRTAQGKGQAESFAEHLEKLYEAEDRAALAALRRGLGKRPGEASEMHRYVLPYMRGVPEWQEENYYTVASLFGLYPGRNWRRDDGDDRRTNLGASLRRLADESENGSSVERRFVALLNCRKEELPEHLRQIISLLKTKETPVDWALLIRHINHWDNESRWVQREWSRAFWRADGAAPPQETMTSAADESES